MDQGSDNIRQNIETTRDSLTEKLDALEVRARETFDLKHQVAERPWMALGAAVAAGYVLGSMGGESEPRYENKAPHQPVPGTATEYYQSESRPRDSFLSQFDDEIDMLKGAAMATLSSFIRDAVREFIPSISAHLGTDTRVASTSSTPVRGTPSTAQGVSMSEARDQPVINSESIPMTTSYGSNEADRSAEHATPYYPPGSKSDEYQAEREAAVGATRANH
ncbi:hypothetical protein SE17_08385 [Kouleothrix aurantiaca]|jgi:hypothetical protein|uniref:DUF3618 domain-containing protein n=1 Tax=Kouleothrix aurantiaca TaxID=186479 RepID=A0A0P9DJK2_9CHLR|nr:hypothetical protein SE17_08385 [Kouleothrix aurantiaca]